MKLTFLGTGTSTGVPSIACECETCTSDDPRDKRLRVSVLIEHAGQTIIVDTSSDFRQQALKIGLKHLDAVLITHRSEEHTSELQSRFDLVCRLLLEKKKKNTYKNYYPKNKTTPPFSCTVVTTHTIFSLLTLLFVLKSMSGPYTVASTLR